MNLLLDTHVFLWFIGGDDRLSKSARAVIEDEANNVFVSIICLWEIAIKHSIGKLPLNGSFRDAVVAPLNTYRFDLLPIESMDIERIVNMPFYHRDPFDRILMLKL